MRVLFLDIDGVLNHRQWFMKNPMRGDLKGHAWKDSQIDPHCVRVLNQVIASTDAKIVVSSTWRLMDPLKSLKATLRRNGFLWTASMIDVTPDIYVEGQRRLRGNDIQAWLDTRDDVEAIAIVDDDSDMGHLIDRLVKTANDNGGLTGEKGSELITMLMTPFDSEKTS